MGPDIDRRVVSRDTVVVAGAGLAGACAALVLSRTHRVVVLEAEAPAAGASGAAAGLVNPFMGRKARPAWRHLEALDALRGLDAEAGGGSFRRTGVLRPAADDAQAAAFEARAAEHAGLDWLPAAAAAERWPLVRAPHGLLVVRDGGSVDIPAFVEALLDRARERGAEVRRSRLLRVGPHVAITDRETVEARHVVLAVGDGARGLEALAGLPLHRVKGQTARVVRPDGLASGHPPVSGAGYAVPGPDGVVVGSTFEHAFSDLDADPGLDAGLVARAAGLLPGLEGARVLDRRAGVRLTVPATASPRRLPLCGPLPGLDGVWALTGLGAKGLLLAPLLAERLGAAVRGERPVPAEVAPRGV